MNIKFKFSKIIFYFLIIGLIFLSSIFYLGFNVNSNTSNFKNANLDISQNSSDVSSEQFSNLQLGISHSGIIYTDEKGIDHLYMWGRGIDGQLGNGISGDDYYSNVPIEIDPDGTSNRDGTPDGIQGTVTNLSLGDSNSSAIVINDGKTDHLYMWGENFSNLPQEINVDKDTPEGEADGIQGTITSLSLGDNYFGVVIKDSGGNDHVYTWGLNSSGQLGNGTADSCDEPKQIYPEGTNKIIGTVTNFDMGEKTSGMVINNNGTDHLYMWGNDNSGSLGNGYDQGSPNLLLPTEIEVDDGGEDGIQGTITYLTIGPSNGGIVIEDEGGNDHLYMWGSTCVTSDENNVPNYIPKEIKDFDGGADGIQGTVTNLVFGAGDSAGIVINDGNTDHLYIWGKNDKGQIGNGTDGTGIDNEYHLPTEINVDKDTPGGDADGIQGTITSLSLGDSFAGVTINDGNIDKVYMWGYNSFGQLGNITSDDSNVPIVITPSLLIEEATIINSSNGTGTVTINWYWEKNSANSIDKLELIGTDVNGDGATSVDLLNDNNSNFESGSYSVNLKYGNDKYTDWKISYSTNFGYGTVDIEPFSVIENVVGDINISEVDITYLDEDVKATFGISSTFEDSTKIKDSKIIISGKNIEEQIIKYTEGDSSFEINLDYGTEYNLTASYTLITDTNQVGDPMKYVIPTFQTVEHVRAPTINSVSIDEESITGTTAILDYSINIPGGEDSISIQDTIITCIKVTDKNGKLYGSINNENNEIISEGHIELSELIPEQSYNDLYIVVYAEGNVAGDKVIVNEDDSIEEGHIGGFKLSISMIILYSALLIFVIGSIIGLIIGLTWYFIRRKKSLIM